jgi:hypothetical protein
MKKISAVISFLILFSLSSFAQETFTHEAAGVQITVPGGWTYEQGDNDITFYPPDKDFFVIVALHEPVGVEKLVEDLFNALERSYIDIKMDPPSDDEQNGMKGWSLAGTAKTKENEVQVVIAYGMYATPKDKILELGVIATPNILEKYNTELNMISKNIKPIVKE